MTSKNCHHWKDQLVGHLKKVINAEKASEFLQTSSSYGNPWRSRRSFEESHSDELLAIRKIPKHFPDPPPAEECIHVIVEPLVSTATSSQEVLELREQLASLQALFNKSAHG
jgi:hypothetical protein